MKIQKWLRRPKLALSAVRRLWKEYGYDRPQMNAVVRQVNLPTQPTDLRSFLRELMQIPQQIIEHEKEPERLRARLDAAEPIIKVARADEPQAFAWTGAATIEFPSRQIAGKMSIRWNGSAVEGTLEYPAMPPESDFVEITFPQPGRLHDEESYGKAVIDSPALQIERISGNFDAFIPVGEHIAKFSARKLIVGAGNGATIHRYVYRGGRLRGWRDGTERGTFNKRGFKASIERDSFSTEIFGRRARVTRIQDDSANQYNRLIGVSVEGAPLDPHEQDVFWHVISFVSGTRLQTAAIEHYDGNGNLLQTEYLSGVEFGTAGTHPPFDFRAAYSTFNPAAFGALADGFSRLIKDGFPLAVALHHLQDANTGYTQVEIKNLLFCIHTLFEAWTDANDQRYIENEKAHKALRRQLDAQLTTIFAHDPELYQSVRDAIKFAFRRVGAVLQEIFFDCLSTTLSSNDLRALRKRNPLFHNGYIVPKKGQTQQQFLQELIDDAGTLRTIAHEALLKLSGYEGPFFDYRTWSERAI